MGFPGCFYNSQSESCGLLSDVCFRGKFKSSRKYRSSKKRYPVQGTIRMEGPGNGLLFMVKQYLCWQLWVGEVLCVCFLCFASSFSQSPKLSISVYLFLAFALLNFYFTRAQKRLRTNIEHLMTDPKGNS